MERERVYGEVREDEKEEEVKSRKREEVRRFESPVNLKTDLKIKKLIWGLLK